MQFIRSLRYLNTDISFAGYLRTSKIILVENDRWAIIREPFYSWVFRDIRGLLPKMNTLTDKVKPPESVRGMTELDREKFEITLKVPFIAVHTGEISKYLTPAIKQHLLKIYGIPPVVDATHAKGLETHKQLLFNPETVNSIKGSLPELEFVHVKVLYKNWLFGDIMRAVLPTNIEGVGGFSTIGHIVHFNLRNEVLEYKSLIGRFQTFS